MAEIERVYVGLGGNVGNVIANMADALSWFDAREDCAVVAVSRLYSTPPWGITDQARFVNGSAALDTSLEPYEFLEACLEAERRAGRIRAERNGPRTLDIDVLLFGDRRIEGDDLKVPHPRMTERAFVMIPLADIAADTEIEGATVAQYAAVCDPTGVELLEDRLDWRSDA